MPTPLDRALHSKNAVLAFGGIVAAVTAWTMYWNSDTPLFPPEPDPKGDPETWTETQLKRWLQLRNLHPSRKDTREELIQRVKLNMRAP